MSALVAPPGRLPAARRTTPACCLALAVAGHAALAAAKPIGPVVIDYPTFDGEADHYTGEFDLFIDDSGGVVRVVSATPDLPGILGNAVCAAFLGARFAPGEVEGRAVRSRIRIEVTFDSRRPPNS